MIVIAPIFLEVTMASVHPGVEYCRKGSCWENAEYLAYDIESKAEAENKTIEEVSVEFGTSWDEVQSFIRESNALQLRWLVSKALSWDSDFSEEVKSQILENNFSADELSIQSYEWWSLTTRLKRDGNLDLYNWIHLFIGEEMSKAVKQQESLSEASLARSHAQVDAYGEQLRRKRERRNNMLLVRAFRQITRFIYPRNT